MGAREGNFKFWSDLIDEVFEVGSALSVVFFFF